MLASQFEHSLAPMMADDSMEISSDHGHNDDDIDIDIEFTAGDDDGGEDYMVDDTPMNTGFEDNHNNEDLLTAADELMVDDTSVVDEMNDHQDGPLDLMIDDAAVTMFDETIEEPVAENDQPTSTLAAEFSQDIHVPGSENQGVPNLAVDQAHHEQQVKSDIYESTEVLESTIDSVHADPVTSSFNTGHDSADIDANPDSDVAAEQGVLAQLGTEPEDSEEFDTKLSLSLDTSARETATSPRKEEKSELVGENEICQPDEQTDLTKSPPASNPDDAAHIAQEHTSEYQSNTIEEPATENALVLPPEVVIVWRSAEYSLFPKSEFDDPDTFFLSDPSILEQPIGDLLQSIRDVIHAELEDEAELCLAVEDLALEIEETSTHLRDYTFGQIIEVFNKLLENDMEDVRPLYVMLRSRANFSKRYDVCKSSAIDGKGLSEVMIFREDSESQEDFAANAENSEFDGGLNPGVEGGYDEEHRNVLDDGSQNSQTENNPDSGSPQVDQETESWNNDNEQHPKAGEEDNTGAFSSQHTVAQESLPKTDSPKPSDVVRTEEGTVASTLDEDDLIDYSDEETEEPNTKDRASTPTEAHDVENQVQNVEEYEANNEELQRRPSLSGAAEGSGALQPGNDEDQNTPKVEIHVETEKFGDELDYEEVDSKGQEDPVSKDITDESGKDKYDDKPLEGQYVGEVESAESGQQVDTQEASFQEIQEHGENYEEDFELGEEDPQDAETRDFDAVDFQQEEYNGLEESGGAADETTAHLELDDAAESSATVSADEPHHEDDFTDLDLDEFAKNEPVNDTNPEATLPDEDEIDYEDDGDNKDVDVTIVQPPISTTPNGSTKRSISEVEVDAITAPGAQENKRSKS